MYFSFYIDQSYTLTYMANVKLNAFGILVGFGWIEYVRQFR